MEKSRFTNIKRNTILLIMSFLVLTSFQRESRAKEFIDMPNDWSRRALEKAVANDLIRGDGDRVR